MMAFRNIKLRLVLAAAIITGMLLISFNISAHSLRKVDIDEVVFKQLDRFVQEKMQAEQIKGLSYAVLLDGKLIHKNGLGYANLEWKIPAKADTVYAIASITKLLSTTAIHHLLKSKNRSVDETIGSFLPDLPESWQSLTLKQLLSHTSGLPRYILDLGINPENREAVFQAMKDKPFEFKPGEKNVYNQTGYLLLLMLVEVLSDKSLEQYLQIHFFDALKMNRTQYGNVREIVPGRASHYMMTDAGLQVDLRMDYTSPIHAAAGLNSSVEELAVWFEALLSGKILNLDEFKTIWTPVRLNSGVAGDFSMGWQVVRGNDFSSAGHGGGDFAEARHYWHHGSENAVTVILLTNGANWQGIQNINVGIADHFLPGLLDPSVKLYYDFKSAINNSDFALIKRFYRTFRDRYSKDVATLYSIYGHNVVSSENPVNYLGFWLMEKNRPRDALYYFKQNVKDYPESVNAWDSLASGYEANKQFNKAQKALNTARDLLAGENDPYYSMVMDHIKQLNDQLK